MELTQVRRAVSRLVARGWARSAEGRRFALTAPGLEALVEELTADADGRSFEDALFVACFARCYGAAIVARAPASRRRATAERLSPARLLREAESRVERIIADLEERVRSSEAMQREARVLRRGGASPSAVAAALDRRDAYQLQHVRAFGELMRALPEDLLGAELDEGIELRSALLFAPLVTRARAERAILASLRARL
jgi:hypothetical protein